jgi:sulfate adenylyltransferase subunit 1 (EFTu-like GTPase family)
MATTHHNISGELTQELLAVGDDVNVTSISLVNIHASTTCTVDLYIEKKLTGKFYIMKSLQLPVGATLILEGNDVKFSNKAGQFGLYIKLTQGASETPTVDVIIS